MGSLFQPEKLLGVSEKADQDKFAVAELLRWTHTLQRPVFEPDRCASAESFCLSLPWAVGMGLPTYGWRGLQCWFVLVCIGIGNPLDPAHPGKELLQTRRRLREGEEVWKGPALV